MPFVCKPSGGYTQGGDEWQNNVDMVHNILHDAGWTDYAIAGTLGAFQMESGMNPWRWESDVVRLDGYGYGLPQFTPARGYVELTGVVGHAPNMSTSGISGGNVSDGIAQTNVVRDNAPLAKWTGVTWRSYWDTTTYASAWARCQQIRNRYGRNSFTYDYYQHNITDVNDAAYIFFSAYEGPGNANAYTSYEAAARYAYEYITGHAPEPPEPPEPPISGTGAWFGVFHALKKRKTNFYAQPRKRGGNFWKCLYRFKLKTLLLPAIRRTAL